MVIFEKLHWIIWIILVCYYVKVDAHNDIDKNEIVQRFRGYRDSCQRKHSDFNMWKLEWNDNLEQQARQVARNWEPKTAWNLKNGPDYRPFLTMRNLPENSEFLKLESDTLDYFLRLHYFHNILNPDGMRDNSDIVESVLEAVANMQREIGCALTDFKMKYSSKDYHYDLLCLVGPHVSHIFQPLEDKCEKLEEPGILEDGMCVPDPNNPLPTRPPPTTMAPKKVNQSEDDDDDDVDEESTKEKRKNNRKQNKDEEYDLILDLNSVRMEKGTMEVFLLALIVAF